MPVVGRPAPQEVQADGIIVVCRIEIDDVIGTPGRDVVEQFLRQVSVRVDEPHPFAGGDILQKEVLE